MVLLVNNNNLDTNSITYINDVQKTFENAFFNQIEGKGLTCYVLVDVNNDIRNFSLNYKSLPTSDFNSIFGNNKQNILINSAGEIIFENIAPDDLRISIANQLKRR